MPREIALQGVYLPSVTLLLPIAMLLTWGLDRQLTRFGLYERVWHPALFRVSLFACLYAGMALYVYR